MKTLFSIFASATIGLINGATEFATHFYEKFLYRVLARSIFFGFSVGIIAYSLVSFSILAVIIGFTLTAFATLELLRVTRTGVIAGKDIPKMLMVTASGFLASIGIIVLVKMSLINFIAQIASNVR